MKIHNRELRKAQVALGCIPSITLKVPRSRDDYDIYSYHEGEWTCLSAKHITDLKGFYPHELSQLYIKYGSLEGEE